MLLAVALLVPGGFVQCLLVPLHGFPLMFGLPLIVFLLLLHGAVCFALVFANGLIFLAGKSWKRGKRDDGEQQKGRDAFHGSSD
jgi:hypothetical protein